MEVLREKNVLVFAKKFFIHFIFWYYSEVK